MVEHMPLACLSRGRLREVDVDLRHTPRRQRAAQCTCRVARDHLEVVQPLHRRLGQDEARAVAPQLERNPARLWLGRRLQHDPVARPRAHLDLHHLNLHHLNLHRRASTRPRRRRRGGCSGGGCGGGGCGGGCGGSVWHGGVRCSGHGRDTAHC